MTGDELDRLLGETVTVGVVLDGPDGQKQEVLFTRHELERPVAMRAAWRRQTGWEMPRYGQEDHDQIVRVLLELANREELQ